MSARRYERCLLTFTNKLGGGGVILGNHESVDGCVVNLYNVNERKNLNEMKEGVSKVPLMRLTK